MKTKYFLVGAFLLLISCSSKPKTENSSQSYQGHGSESVSPELIKKFTAPTLETTVSARIQSMLDVRSAGSGILSPDGKSLFYSWRVTGVSQVWRIDGPMGFPVQMTGGQDATSVSDITPDGKFLILSRDRRGEENPGLYLQNVKGGPLEVIQHKAKVQTSYVWVTDDSRFIYYRANDVKNDSYAIYKYDLKNKKAERIFDQDGVWFVADVNTSGEFILARAKGSLSQEYFLFDEKTKKLTPIIGQNEDEDYQVAFSKNKNEYFVLSNKFSDFKRLYHFKNNKMTAISPEKKMDLEEFAIDKKREKLFYSWNDQGYTRLDVVSAQSYKSLGFPKFPEADHLFIGRISRNSRYVTFSVDTAKAPRVNFVYDWQSQKATQWLKPSTPEVDTSQFARAELEYYPARDGVKIPMWVRRPANCKAPCPVVVHFHGGPEAQTRPGFSIWGQMFVDAGFVFAEPNVRGSDGYGKKWLDSDNAAKRLNVITDIEDASIFIRKNWAHNGVAPKVGVTGGSYGGYSTLYAMTKFAGAYDAGVASVGMSNLVTFLNNTAPYRRILRISEYGDPVKDKEALIELSPVTHLDKIKAPLMIIQGVNDPRVPAGEAIQMYDKMKACDLDAQLILFADEGHGASKRENQVLEIGHTIAFFEKHLKK
jgi:dipeptidyl aminopeptidase/acylaminoacyl peptidase